MRPAIAVPAVLALAYYAHSRRSLTPTGIAAAVLTAAVHAAHPWSLPFVLLCIFFLAGSRVTAVKRHIKASLTVGATGAGGAEGARTHIQVLANSLLASILALLHARELRLAGPEAACFGRTGADVLLVGLMAHYAAVAADTFSSELGILSRQQPRLLTSLRLRTVPRGTNGGVTALGLGAGLLGAGLITAAAVPLLPLCASAPPPYRGRVGLAAGLLAAGLLGTLLDSLLGGWLQCTVQDARSGKVVEGDGGGHVLVGPAAVNTGRPSRVVVTGRDLLDNNGINLLMATTISLGAIIVAAWVWAVPLNRVLS